MNIGVPVVLLYKNDTQIYRIALMHNEESCDIISYIDGKMKTVSINQIREAYDVEIMVGYRLNK